MTKAIGWALRERSYVDAQDVLDHCERESQGGPRSPSARCCGWSGAAASWSRNC
ncbi:hypothetical protein [Williamsia sp. CHRR-6]|uniref:hypothetical protein n=1 Tax=Williamsia sp. CHRR-6 TaxID=2835871 RepID=UPI001BD939E9|nr:hypothetical protein [Williamsia sp. CHRR-6]